MKNRILNNIRSSWLKITGLAIGFACFIMIALWVYNEKSYDRFNNDVTLLYRISRHEASPQGSVLNFACTPSPLGPELAEKLPEINDYTRFYRLESLTGEVQIEYGDEKFFEKEYCFADPSFFSLFNFPFIYGDPNQALLTPNSVVLTAETAGKYFKNENPIGRIIKVTNMGEYVVTGVVENIPSNSHIKFDFLSPLEPLMKEHEWMRRWNIPHFYTYVSLEAEVEANLLDLKIEDLFNELNISELKSLNTMFRLLPVTDIHLHSELDYELSGNGKYISDTMKMFSVLASFVLLISCLNFMIIFIAKAFERKTEIGIRKTFGAARNSIARMFYFETFVIVLIGFCVGLLIVLIIYPVFNNFIGIDISLKGLRQIGLITTLLLIILLSSAVSGLYPAIFISSFKPVLIIKGILFTKNPKGRLIKSFVIIQYTLYLFFIIGSLVYYGQYKYLINKDLGYNSKHLYCIRSSTELRKQFDAFKTTLLNNPSIINVTSCSDLPVGTVNKTIVKEWEGASTDDQVMMNYLYVDEDYINTMGIKLKKGRDFELATDKLTGFIINEEAEKQMGMDDALDKDFSIYSYSGEIVGVIEDFHFGSLIGNIDPLVIKVQPNYSKYILISIREKDPSEALNYIEATYNKFSSIYHFEAWPLDAAIKDLYQNEENSSRLIFSFSILGILIASFGLYGLIDYSLKLRIREIGIRKVLGANSTSILNILFKEYGIMIFFASLLAWSTSYFYFNNWLNNYAYKDSIHIWYFICAPLISASITAAIILIQSYSTAKLSPSEILKYE